MAELKATAAQYQELNTEWNKGKNRNRSKVFIYILPSTHSHYIVGVQMSSLLSQLKVSLTSLSFLPTGAADPKELTVARNTLEIGAKFAVAEGDIPMFERYMAQLQTYYYDYTSLAESDFK